MGNAKIKHYCAKCGSLMDEKEFYVSRNKKKYPPNGRMDICKKCLTMHVDNWEPDTYKWILKEIDVPYIKSEWDALLEKYGQDPTKITGLSILGRYLSKMKLNQWNKYHWEDSDKIAEKELESKVVQMKT